LVTIVIACLGRGCAPALRHVEQVAMLFHAAAPPPADAASNTSSEPASDPVWLAAALAAASVRPALNHDDRLGQRHSRAAERNFRASPIVSM